MREFSCGEVDLSRRGVAAQRHIQACSPQVFAENLLAALDAAIAHACR